MRRLKVTDFAKRTVTMTKGRTGYVSDGVWILSKDRLQGRDRWVFDTEDTVKAAFGTSLEVRIMSEGKMAKVIPSHRETPLTAKVTRLATWQNGKTIIGFLCPDLHGAIPGVVWFDMDILHFLGMPSALRGYEELAVWATEDGTAALMPFDGSPYLDEDDLALANIIADRHPRPRRDILHNAKSGENLCASCGGDLGPSRDAVCEKCVPEPGTDVNAKAAP